METQPANSICRSADPPIRPRISRDQRSQPSPRLLGSSAVIKARLPVCAVLLGLFVGGCSLGRAAAVDDNVVLPLPAGFEVIARSTTSCGGVEDAGGDWRDLVIRPSQDTDTALTTIRAHLESRGFRLAAVSGPATVQWPRYRGATEAVGAELGTGADYRRDGSQVGPNPAVVRSASGASDLVLRLHPAQADCMT